MAVQYHHSYFYKHLEYGRHLTKQECVLVLRAAFAMVSYARCPSYARKLDNGEGTRRKRRIITRQHRYAPRYKYSSTASFHYLSCPRLLKGKIMELNLSRRKLMDWGKAGGRTPFMLWNYRKADKYKLRLHVHCFHPECQCANFTVYYKCRTKFLQHLSYQAPIGITAA